MRVNKAGKRNLNTKIDFVAEISGPSFLNFKRRKTQTMQIEPEKYIRIETIILINFPLFVKEASLR